MAACLKSALKLSGLRSASSEALKLVQYCFVVRCDQVPNTKKLVNIV